jgi:ABC-type multidrug transport system permease subunit
MKTVITIVAIATILFVGMTLLCGFWTAAHAGPTGPAADSIAFHRMLALITSALSLLLAVLAIANRS